MKTTIAGMSILLAFTFLAPRPTVAQASEPLPDIVVEVRGMSCPFCSYGIEKKFVERPEVDSIFVALEAHEVRLWLKPERALSDEAVQETVEEAGFTPGPIRRPSANRP